MLRLVFALLAVSASQALAMNWEGHEDWTDTFAPGLVFEQAVPEARPLPRRDCPVRPEQAAANPYEQVPLPRHKCKPADGVDPPAR